MLRYISSFLKQKQNVINHKFVSSNTNVLIRQQISSGLGKHSNGSIKTALSAFSALLGLLCGSPLVFQFLRKVIVFMATIFTPRH